MNVNGVFADYQRDINGKSDLAWNSAAVVRTAKTAAGWTADVSIPLQSLGKINPAGFAVNFGRNRMLKGKQPVVTAYQWSPLPAVRKGYHAVENWGRLRFEKPEDPIIPNGNFTQRINYRNWTHLPNQWASWRSGGPDGGQIQKLDDKIFITGGQSFYFKNIAGQRLSSYVKLKSLKPGRKYRLSYFVRTCGITGKKGAGVFLILNKTIAREYPKRQVSGTQPWHRLVFEFTTPADYRPDNPRLGIWIWDAAGEAWFDDVRIDEIPSDKDGSR